MEWRPSSCSDSGRLSGKVALVTGASRGIGKVIALGFAKEGADVAIVDILDASETVGDINKSGREAIGVKGDVTKRVDIEEAVQLAVKKFGKIDVLVNNAGVVTVRPAEEMTEDEWDRDMDVNLKGSFLCSQVIGKAMIKQQGGNIINIASMVAKAVLPGHIAYCASKAGVIALTKVLAVEWAKYNIRVNAIAPGFIKTELVADLVEKGLRSKEEMEMIEKRTPLRRWGTPQDVSDVALFLASDDSAFVTGQTVFVEGGWLSYGYV